MGELSAWVRRELATSRKNPMLTRDDTDKVDEAVEQIVDRLERMIETKVEKGYPPRVVPVPSGESPGAMLLHAAARIAGLEAELRVRDRALALACRDMASNSLDTAQQWRDAYMARSRTALAREQEEK